MKKRLALIVSCAIALIIALWILIEAPFHHDTVENNGRFDAIELHSEEGNFITYAIKETNSYHAKWKFVVPQWFSKYFGCQFYWCNDADDFIILSADTGLHLYLYDPASETWQGDYYLRTYAQDDSMALFYWDQGKPINPFPPEKVPIEVTEYLREIETTK